MQRLAVIALVGVLLAGCGDDDDSPSGSTRAPTSSTTAAPSTTPTLESEVEAAYLAYSEMFTRLLGAPNPNDPEIRQRATGEAADSLTDNLTTLRALNRAVRFGPDYRYELLSVEVSGAQAVGQECVVDDATVVDAASGEAVDPAPVATVLNRITLRHDDVWRVSQIVQEDGWEGVDGCAR